MSGAPSERANTALAALSVSIGARDLNVMVLDSNDVGAYCWESGHIVLTRGLMELADDEELIAAIAHEVGHLLAEGHLPRPAALAGCEPDQDLETQADLVAHQLLQANDLQSDALPRLLEKIAALPRTSPRCREDLNRRVARLTQLY